MSNNNNITSSDNSDNLEQQTPTFTSIINGLQNIVDTANLQANNNYYNPYSDINPNTGSFNPFFNLDSVNQTNDSVVFDFSYVFPENQYISSSDTNISASDDGIWASDTEEISYTFTSDLNDGSVNITNNTPGNIIEGSDSTQSVNSEYMNFANELMNYLNGTLSDLDIGNSSLTEALNRSFAEKQKYKKVISDLGKKQIKLLSYPNKLCNQTYCAITQEEFLTDQEIILLPCGHCFNSDAIMNWLENEKSECPICRFKLDSKEVKDESSETEISDDTENSDETENNEDTENSDETENSEETTTPLFTPELTQQLLQRVMTRAYDNRIQEIQQQEEDELQRAIMASLEQSDYNNDKDNDEDNNETNDENFDSE